MASMAVKPYRATAHWKRIRLQVLRRDAYTCAYCGDVADQVDHVHPKSKGGADELDNLVAACKRCNYAKRDKTDAFFLAQRSTPPALANSLSPIRANQSKSVQNGHTLVRVDPDSPFIGSSDLGASDK
jgi:hypothetical protein